MGCFVPDAGWLVPLDVAASSSDGVEARAELPRKSLSFLMNFEGIIHQARPARAHEFAKRDNSKECNSEAKLMSEVQEAVAR